mmetsp:Transcript_48423/g.67287  ORF Transcript_48423/g.67287 Transcript_48423/m.67287 type:complete len:292 (+) Transcript_48423:20-895(+)
MCLPHSPVQQSVVAQTSFASYSLSAESATSLMNRTLPAVPLQSSFASNGSYDGFNLQTKCADVADSQISLVILSSSINSICQRLNAETSQFTKSDMAEQSSAYCHCSNEEVILPSPFSDESLQLGNMNSSVPNIGFETGCASKRLSMQHRYSLNENSTNEHDHTTHEESSVSKFGLDSLRETAVSSPAPQVQTSPEAPVEKKSLFLPRQRMTNTACPHKDKKHYAKNMCSACYHRRGRTKAPWKCQHLNRAHYARGLCQNCYLSMYHKKKNFAKRRTSRKSLAKKASKSKM